LYAALALAPAFALGLVPAQGGSLSAAAVLGLVALILGIAWLVGLLTGADPWLVWWTFVFAGLGLGAAGALAFGSLAERVRTPRSI
jgi:hypothetical protein